MMSQFVDFAPCNPGTVLFSFMALTRIFVSAAFPISYTKYTLLVFVQIFSGRRRHKSKMGTRAVFVWHIEKDSKEKR